MFFEDMFFEILENEIWLPIIAALAEDEERDFEEMTDDEIKNYLDIDI